MNTPETMTDFSNLTPPPELMARWIVQCRTPNSVGRYDEAQTLMAAARWGAEQAAERLANQWPTPITDRPPEDGDGDVYGLVQVLRANGWEPWNWKRAVETQAQWRHTPRWQPPAPPTLTPQQQEAMDALDHILKHSTTNLGEAVIRRAILGGEA